MQHIVFANTGVQLICQPLTTRLKLSADQLGWQRCQGLGPDGALKPYHFLQWQVRNGEQLFFAVDTTCGDPEKGFFCRADALAGDVIVAPSQVADSQQRPIPNFPPVEIVIRPATAAGGDALPVQLVVDFGNSRTGALLIETSADHETLPLMEPFELLNRFQLNMWDEAGQFRRRAGSRWFNSRTQWCQSPYLAPPKLEVKFYAPVEERPAGRFLERWRGGAKPPEAQFLLVTPRLFQDLSPARMGEEVDDVSQAMRADAELCTGVSSPKRYLWAADGRWLAGGVWHMADPWQRTGTRARSAVLQGPFFRFIGERDPDELQLPDPAAEVISEEDAGREAPLQPRHPPRVLMVAAIYELLCQAAVYLNSAGYRRLLGEAVRPREIRNVALTFPSGMIPQERERFRMQAQKAVDIFCATLGRAQRVKPHVSMSIDEASAVHLTYIWSELQILERNAKVWFSLMGKPRATAHAAAGQSSPRSETTAPPAALPEVRIGCIDIGGGTSDLMIARYTFQAGPVDTMEGEMLHRDGISLAGDQLAKRLIERIIIPHLADRVGFGREEVMRLFGQEVPSNHRFRAQRINWINRLFMPLVQAYLQAAGDDDRQTTFTHTDPTWVAEEVLASLEQTIDQEFGAGQFNLRQELALRYDPDKFNQLVFEVFNELLLDFCGRLVKYDVDVVLLAGQPTKLRQIQDLVRQYLPLQAARVVPLHNHYAGNWYPYQDLSGRDPGVIVDPKSAVVVGAAVELLMSRGRLGNIQFSMKDLVDQDRQPDNEYYWGILTEGTCRIQDSRLLFRPPQPGEQPAAVERQSFRVVAERLLIGRRLSPSENAEASAVWALRVDRGDRDGKIDLTVTIERRRRVPGNSARPEALELVEVRGTVAGEPADMQQGPGQNVFFYWRTLAAESYFLDTGALDSIEM
ncbi:MAG TPA: virulence factor SrfB [Planctomycetaceae bacterium]|jgi:hypothetical protein